MRTEISKRSALALLCAALHAGPAFARTTDDIVEETIRPLLARHGVPGIAVGLTLANARRFHAFGVASHETKAPVTEDTLFELGSISKIFTATLAAEAEAKGVLSLDSPVDSLVPDLRDTPVGRASLLQLATYTAGGLPLQFPDGLADERSAIAWFRRWTPAETPGAVRLYSNPSIVLLGLAVARALHRGQADAIEDLLSRLGMPRSRVRVPYDDHDRYAQGYDLAGNPVRLSPGTLAAGAYGVKATPADMLTFLEASLAPDRLGPSLRRAVEDTRTGRYRVGPMVQGLGWEIYPGTVGLDRLLSGNASDMAMKPQSTEWIDPPLRSEGGFVNKTGSTNGFGAYVALVPRKAAGLVILANCALPIPARVTAAHAILEAIGG